MCWKPASDTGIVWAIDTLRSVQAASQNAPWWLPCLGGLGIPREVSISLLGCGAGPYRVLFSDGVALGTCFGEVLSPMAPGACEQGGLSQSWSGAALAPSHQAAARPRKVPCLCQISWDLHLSSPSSTSWPNPSALSYLCPLSPLCGAFLLCEASQQ